MRHVFLLILFLALPAHGTSLLSRCVAFLRNESGSVKPWGADGDEADAAKLAELKRQRLWPEVFSESVIGSHWATVQKEFLDRVRDHSFAHVFGYDVAFDYKATVLNDGKTDSFIVEVTERPQRVLSRNELPSAERFALEKLLRRPESKLTVNEGFRESLAVVGYLGGGGALVTETALGDPFSVPMPAVDAALREAEAMAKALGTPLFAATLVHVHPEANVPLTTSDIALAERTARALRIDRRQGGFVAILAGGAHSPDKAAFRYATYPRRRSR